MKQENLHSHYGTSAVTVCPVCEKEVALKLLGINSHLKAHVRKGLITEADKIIIRALMMKRKAPQP